MTIPSHEGVPVICRYAPYAPSARHVKSLRGGMIRDALTHVPILSYPRGEG